MLAENPESDMPPTKLLIETEGAYHVQIGTELVTMTRAQFNLYGNLSEDMKRKYHKTFLDAQAADASQPELEPENRKGNASFEDKRVALAILDFFSKVSAENGVDADGKEGLEVARQCISTAFGVDSTNEDQRKQLGLSPPVDLTSMLQTHAPQSCVYLLFPVLY